MKHEVPIAEKALLTVDEASEYFNIGPQRIRDLTNDDNCPYVLWIGTKRLIKREMLKEFLYSQYSI